MPNAGTHVGEGLDTLMDLQGIGAIAAVPTTVIVGFLAWWGAARQAKAAADAGRAQARSAIVAAQEQAQSAYQAALDAVREQARTGHQQWRSNLRRETWAAFLLAVSRYDSAGSTLYELRNEERLQETQHALDVADDALAEAFAIVELEGPEHEASLVREQADREERRAREEREFVAAREAAERAERERREREREQREHEREQREHEAEISERQERERAENERRALAEQAERERREREERAERERDALLQRGPAASKLPEDEARRIVTAAFAAGLSVRQAAELCGWSVGWVSARYAEHRDPAAGGAELAIAGN